MISKRLAFIICSLLLLSACDEIWGIYANNKALHKMEQEDAASAEQQLLKSMADNPADPIPHINLGLLYEMGKKYDKATREYQSILKFEKINPELNFIAKFNSGNSLAADKKLDQALTNFQAALDTVYNEKLEPDYAREVKTNIELLMQSGQGQGQGGQGEGQNQSENQDQNEGQNQNQDKQYSNEQKQKEFKSENLTQEDVRKILDELKSQEKKIRAMEYNGKSKEANPGKDW